MKKHLIFIAAADGTGYAYSHIYASDIGVDDNVISACKEHFKKAHEYSDCIFYMDRGSVQTVPVSDYSGDYTSAKDCLVAYEKAKAEEESAEIEELKRLKEKYPHMA